MPEGKVYRKAHTEMTHWIFFLRILIGQPASHKRLKVSHIADVEFDPARATSLTQFTLSTPAIYGRTEIRKTSCNDKNMDRHEHSN